MEEADPSECLYLSAKMRRRIPEDQALDTVVRTLGLI